MSLLSQWQTDEDLIYQAFQKSLLQPGGSGGGSEDDPDYLETLFMNKNQWRCLRYTYNTNVSSSTPSYSGIRTLLSNGIQYRGNDSTTTNWNWADHYYGIRECYVYCTQAYTLSTSFWTDDPGRIYLNGSSRATCGSCVTTSVSLPFKKGLNHVEILFYEWEGGDGGNLATSLYSQSWVKWQYACYKQ